MRFIIAPLLLVGFAVSVAVAQRSPTCIVPGTQNLPGGPVYMPWLGLAGGGWLAKGGVGNHVYLVAHYGGIHLRANNRH